MAMPLSNDLRKRIIKAKEAGQTVAKISENFLVSESAINRIVRRYRETGSSEPKEHRGGREAVLKPESLKEINDLVLAEPDITLDEIKERLQLPVGITTLCNTINYKLGLRRKKVSACSGAGKT